MSLKGRVNGYGCLNPKCHHVMITVDIDDGTTPFITRCPKCGYDAQSFCYPKIGCPTVDKATHEWYSPDAAERKTLHRYDLEHVEKGGLLLRERGEKAAQKKRRFVSTGKVGRNDACPCGSGGKYKRCCGRVK